MVNISFPLQSLLKFTTNVRKSYITAPLSKTKVAGPLFHLQIMRILINPHLSGYYPSVDIYIKPTLFTLN